MAVRWSVSVRADGDREVSREEVVALADAVAGMGGVAAGIGTTTYGAQLVVEAQHPAEAAELAQTAFARAAAVAGLPAWPIGDVLVVGEDEDE